MFLIVKNLYVDSYACYDSYDGKYSFQLVKTQRCKKKLLV